MLFPLVFELPAFLLGLIFGSFLNVCISRLPGHRSLATPRSHCPECLKTIRWYDNVPLLSWVLLGAKCRHCKGAIPWRYPLVELAMGLWFGYIAWRCLDYAHAASTGLTTEQYVSLALFVIAMAVAGFLLIGLLVMDWQTHRLPDAFTLPGILIGFVLVCIQALFLTPGQDQVILPQNHVQLSSPGSSMGTGNVFFTGPEHMVLGRLLAIVAAACVLLVIRGLYKALRHREGLGLGDVKLLAMVAALLGFWPSMLALFLGCVLASIYALTLLVRRKAGAATALPLGTFLSIGGLIAALLGGPLIAWYTGLL